MKRQRESYEETEAEIRDAATSQGMSGATRCWKRQEGPSPTGFRGPMALSTPDLRLHTSRTVRQ